MPRKKGTESGPKRKPGRPKKDNPELKPLNNLSPLQKQVLFVTGLQKLERLIQAVKVAGNAVKAQRKVMKGDGFPKEEVDYALFLRRSDDTTVREDAASRDRAAKYLAHPIGHQFTLLDEDRTPASDRAFEDGKVAGIAGETCSPPHAPDTEKATRWMEGWQEGQAALLAAFTPLASDDDPYFREVAAE